MNKNNDSWIRRWLAPGMACLLLLQATTPAMGQSVNFVPATLTFSPAGPYSIPRDAAVGLQVATAMATASAGDLTCDVIETAIVNGTEITAGSGIYQTSVGGIGVRFYVQEAAGRTLITSTNGGYTSGMITAPGDGALPGIEAQLVVTGQIVSGYSLSSLPSVEVTFTPAGSCAWTTGIAHTLPTNASNSAVVPITCTVTTPSVTVNLPVVSLAALNAVGKTAGDTRFPIGLNCASGANVYITLGDATTPGNTSPLLTLAPSSTAQGVKLRILNSAGPVNFGPDSAEPGTTHQWLLGASNSINGIPLTVQYYRDDTGPSGSDPAALAAGSIHAQATFTMSYQ
ncbi:MAG: fimbrial protein [Pseudomonadota bacterium]